MSWIPDFLWPWALGAGVLSTVVAVLLSVVPLAPRFVGTACIVIGAVLMVAGAWGEGRAKEAEEWRRRVDEVTSRNLELSLEVAAADVRAAETVGAERVVIRKETEEIIRYIEREAAPMDARFSAGGECGLPSVLFQSYNRSLGGKE